jgi:ATP-dependent Zn protease
MITKKKLNITLTILLFISIGINFFKGVESLNDQANLKNYNIQEVFKSSKITEIHYVNEVVIIKTDKLLESYKVSSSQFEEVQKEARKRGITIQYSKYEKPPTWLNAMVNWGPLTLLIFLVLLGVNLSGRFRFR